MGTTLDRAAASAARTAHAAEFAPRRFFSNGHLQTILGNFLPRANSLAPAETTLVEVSPANGSEIASQVRLPVTIFCIGAMNALRCSSIGPASASVAAAMTRD